MGDEARYDEVLNRALHHPNCDPADVVVIYAHRGAPRDRAVLWARDVARATRAAIHLKDGTEIPCHRVLQIRNARTGEVLAGKAQLD